MTDDLRGSHPDLWRDLMRQHEEPNVIHSPHPPKEIDKSLFVDWDKRDHPVPDAGGVPVRVDREKEMEAIMSKDRTVPITPMPVHGIPSVEPPKPTVADSLPTMEQELRRQEWLKTLAPNETARMPAQGTAAWNYIMKGTQRPTGGTGMPITGGSTIEPIERIPPVGFGGGVKLDESFLRKVPPRNTPAYRDLVNMLIEKWAQPTAVERDLGMAEMINRTPPAPNTREYNHLVRELLREYRNPDDILSFKKGGVVKGKKNAEVIVKVHEGEVILPKKTAKELRALLKEESPVVKKRIVMVKKKKKPFKIIRENKGVGRVHRYYKGKKVD